MFQQIEPPSDPKTAHARVKDLRSAMTAANVDAYLVPRADEHQGEYVAPPSERLKWLTGFSGSAGAAVITQRKAAIFVDGRYTVQVTLETDAKLFDYPGLARTKLANWVKSTLKSGDVVGFDPWLITIAEHNRLKKDLSVAGIKLKPVARNLVDKIWGADRPRPDIHLASRHPLKYAGVAEKEKIAKVQDILRKDGHDYVILTAPDSIAWLLNLRGRDIPHTPVVLSFAIVPKTGKPELFVDPEKIPADVKRSLSLFVKLCAPDTLKPRLKAMKASGKVARLDPSSAAYWFQQTLGTASAYNAGRDPCLTLKAIKNKTEIDGSCTAHQRDGAAVTEFLAWLSDTGETASEPLDELKVVEKLEAFRAATGVLQEISFDTISGSGPNGAIVHYRVSPSSNRKLKKGELLLVDSGAQYLDGTTDITRTLAIGKPTAAMRRHYTLVLKGHVAISNAVFPVGTRGVDLDAFARQALWQHGLDYDHGTGHGVGSFLSVHEGPQSLSRAGMVVFEPGMILSNEPGYYKEGAYGIRIENLILVKAPQKPKDGEREMLSFETLTLAPYDRALIDPDLLSGGEIAWINAYHKTVFQSLRDGLSAHARRWLKDATKPLQS